MSTVCNWVVPISTLLRTVTLGASLVKWHIRDLGLSFLLHRWSEFHRHWLLQSDSDCFVQLMTLSASLVQPNLPRIDPNAHFRVVFAQSKAELPITALLLTLAMLMTLSTLLVQPNLARN